MKQLSILILLVFVASLMQAQVISGKSNKKKISTSKQPPTDQTKQNPTPSAAYVSALPDLIIKGEVFVDENGNNLIDANEYCSINLNVENIGEGTAQNVIVRTSVINGDVYGLTYGNDIDLGDIGPDTKKAVSIPVRGYVYLENNMAEFKVEVRESRGFDAFPLEMKIETREFAAPRVVIADAAFGTEDGGLIKLNYPIHLKAIVQNIGAGDADGVFVEFEFPNPNCVVLGEDHRFNIGPLKRGETYETDFIFTATRRYEGNEIPVSINVNESYKKYAEDTLLSVGLQQQLTAQNQVVITGIRTQQDEISRASLTSEVDKNIPRNPKKNEYRYALIIGNEDYSKYQRGLQSESNVDYARNDAKIFREYAVNVMGVEEDNVYLLLDATAGEMQQKIDLVSKLAQKTGANAEIIFYYAGHGLPDEVTHDPYLIPVDVSGTNLASAVPLKTVYKKFGETSASKITIFLDACFSGGGRDATLLAARSVKVKPKQEVVVGNMVVYAASSGEQSALPLHDQQHGIFTYYLLKKIQDSKGIVSYGELAEFIKTKVSLESLKVNQKEQDPQVNVSYNIENIWKAWALND